MPLAARLSSRQTAGTLVLERVPRPVDATASDASPPVERPIPVFTVCDPATHGRMTAITLVAKTLAVERFLSDARSSTAVGAIGPRNALPRAPQYVSVMPMGSSGELNSHLWMHEGDPADAAALVAAFNRATMGDLPFLGFATLCDLSADPAMARPCDAAMDPQRMMLMVRPLAVKTAAVGGGMQRVPRWQAPCWPAAVINSMPAALRPSRAQLDVDESAGGRVGLAIAPAAGQWIATRKWLMDNELVVSGAERPPGGSWMLVVGTRGAGPWAHIALEKARSIVAAMPHLAGNSSWGSPSPSSMTGGGLQIELETAPGWQPDPDLIEFDVRATPGAPLVRARLLRATTRVTTDTAADAASPASGPQTVAQAATTSPEANTTARSGASQASTTPATTPASPKPATAPPSGSATQAPNPASSPAPARRTAASPAAAADGEPNPQPATAGRADGTAAPVTTGMVVDGPAGGPATPLGKRRDPSAQPRRAAGSSRASGRVPLATADAATQPPAKLQRPAAPSRATAAAAGAAGSTATSTPPTADGNATTPAAAAPAQPRPTMTPESPQAPAAAAATAAAPVAGSGQPPVATQAQRSAAGPWVEDVPRDPANAPTPGSLFPFYGVAAGRRIGIFTSWPEVWAATDGWPQNRFRGFTDEATAAKFVKDPNNPVFRVNKPRSGSKRARATRPRSHSTAAPAAADAAATAANGQVTTGAGSGDPNLQGSPAAAGAATTGSSPRPPRDDSSWLDE